MPSVTAACPARVVRGVVLLEPAAEVRGESRVDLAPLAQEQVDPEPRKTRQRVGRVIRTAPSAARRPVLWALMIPPLLLPPSVVRPRAVGRGMGCGRWAAAFDVSDECLPRLAAEGQLVGLG